MQGYFGQGGGGWSGGGGNINWFTFPGLGKVGFNWFGTHPTLADLQYEPNFRHFDWFVDRHPGNVDLIERVWKVPEGEMHWQQCEYGGGSVKTYPVVWSSFLMGMVGAYFQTRAMLKGPHQNRWSLPFNVWLFYMYNNGKSFYAREKLFNRDFQRNQMFAQEEYIRLRKDFRVRQALYELQYVNDPIVEYRLKEFIVSKKSN